MPKVSKQSAAQVDDYGPVENRREEVSDYTIEFVSFRQDIDGTPCSRGCQATAATARTGAMYSRAS